MSDAPIDGEQLRIRLDAVAASGRDAASALNRLADQCTSLAQQNAGWIAAMKRSQAWRTR